MEAGQKNKDSSENAAVLRKPTASRPHLTLPPRSSLEMIFRPSENFPSPMPLTPSFMSELDSDGKPFSFSSLLAGAMNSPSAHFGATTEDKPGRSETANTSYRERQNFESSKELGLGGAMPPTARFKATPPSRLPIPKSSFVTIPPGLSPATLLDSPVLFATHQSEPSPTTGTFPLPPFMHGSFPQTSSLLDSSKVNNFEQSATSNFVFKPAAKPGLQTSFPPLTSLTSVGVTHQQVLSQVQAQARTQTQTQTQAQTQTHPQPQTQTQVSTTTSIVPLASVTSATSSIPPMLLMEAAAVLPIQARAPDNTEKLHYTSPESHLSEESKKGQVSATTLTRTGKPSHDGYNWRKYGQKQVKGSENPRSYYKCTHANCLMKKIVEQSCDGQITEIIYRGEHNHPKPQVTRRTAATNANNVLNGRDLTSFSLNKMGGSKVGGANGSGYIESDRSSKMQEQTKALANGLSEALSPSTSNDEASSKFSEDVDDDDPDAKRRKRERSPKDALLVPRTIREPRVVVQTMSDVDILDDGYRWRKYGQKVVKGNPHPRSYYKCTNIGCPVRKHVERAPTDPNAVITTYEGKHNHDVPLARGSGHENVDAAAVGTQSPLDVSAALTLSTTSLQGQESSFANAVMAPKTEDALEGRTFSSLQYVNTGEISSSDSKYREVGGNAAFSASKFDATCFSTSSGLNNAAIGIGSSLGTLMPFSQPASGTASVQLKKEQSDECANENPLMHQITSTSFHDSHGPKLLL